MIAAILLALIGTGAPSRLQSVAHDTTEPIIVELQLGRIASRTVSAFRRGQVALIPLTGLFDLAEVRSAAYDGRATRATLEPGRRSFVASVETRRLDVDGRTIPLEAADYVVDGGELYVATEPLGEALDLLWNVNWTDLTVTVLDPAGLPLAERLSRDWRRRTAGLRGQPGLVIERTIEPERRTWDGMVIDYSVLAPGHRPIAEGAYFAGLGLDILGGSFTATVQNQGSAGSMRSDVSWFGVFRGRPWLSQLRLGDGLATGPRPRSVRGISFGNSPLVRPNGLGDIGFGGRLGPGWQVEAYRGGRQIAFDSVNALGEFALDAPIQYGENPIDFVAYGPFGEVRRWSRTMHVDANRLGAGRLEYGASAGECRTDLCTANANLDLRYGVSNRLTVRAGIDHFWRDSLADLAHPYAAVYGHLTNALGLEGEVVANAFARGAVRYEPTLNLQLSLEGSRFARRPAAPILTPEGRISQWTLAGFYRPHAGRGGTYFEASVDLIRSAQSTLTTGRLGGSFQSGDLHFMPAVRWQRNRTGTLRSDDLSYEMNAFLLPTPRLGPVFGRVTTRARLALGTSLDVIDATAHLSRNVTRGIRVELGGGWSRFQGTTLSVVVAADLAEVRSYTSLFHSNGVTRSSQYVQGAVLFNRPDGSVSLSAGPALERSGITGRVFLDGNGNQRFDPGEQALQDVRVSIGMETRRSDEQGRYRLWNVTPFEAAIVSVDSTTLASPLWVPAFSAVLVRPGPNRYQIVDIPVVPGGVIEGIVVQAADSTPLAAVPLVLENVATGAEREVVSFSDGQFYSIGVKPGRYRIRVATRARERLGKDAEPVQFTMPAEVEGATVGGLVVRLRPVR